MTENLNKIVRLIDENDDFILISHISPDGDTVGAAIGLAITLRSLNKRARLICQDKPPNVYSYLKLWDEYIDPSEASFSQVAIAIDCADEGRLGRSKAFFDGAKEKAAIDHHITHMPFADITVLDSNASSTGEIVLKIIEQLSETVDCEAATALYTAIVTDTGGFAYSNTTPASHIAAAKLLSFGVDSAKVDRLVYKTMPLPKTKLTGFAMMNTELYDDGKIGLAVVMQRDMLRFSARAEDSEGIIERVRDIEGVEIAMFLRECLDGEFKVSLRSKEHSDVGKLAQDFGGGGHKFAAGFKIGMTLEDLIPSVLKAARTSLRR
ncbi:MAG: bifunctional oligoribonuclease/PAP phosphatase NrnA [Clostridia bacterium]